MADDNQILINLLPQEITDKRKAEKRLVMALLIAAGIGALLFAVFTVNMIRITSRERVLARLEEENSKYQVAINEMKSFQDKQNQVEQLQNLIDSVSDLDFVWSKFFNDVSLIIPNDVWLTKVTSDSKIVSFEGLAVAEATGTADNGHKPVAKWLVHLGQIEGLSDIWLTTSEKQKDKLEGKVKFTSTAKIKQPESSPKPPAVSAPPPSGQQQGGS